ncbi:CAP and S-layer homology domain-containing protein [Vallitalea okinawensis]|uniref:CAP and S-layer homology domain-containing protein n=1 Tax=Vallitalea okinawensis TaxID=2078660 RepID=UPI000CFD8CB3|nr:S-layer homology domain-containing protein [Vallitalea okinawensis]
MKRLATIILVILLSTSVVYGYSATDNTIQYINNIREHVKVTELKADNNLSKAAENHSVYLNTYEKNSKNITGKHTQDSDKVLFAGIYPWDRVGYFNYDINSNPYTNELIYLSDDSPANTVTKMIDNPYYRIELLNPNYQDIGYYKEGDKFVVELGGEKAKTTEVTYPFNHQERIPYQWIDEDNNVYGYPITYSIYAPMKIDKIEIIKIELVNKENSKIIENEIRNPDNDEILTNSIIILPNEPFDANTEYEVSVNIRVTYSSGSIANKNKTWSFETGGKTSTLNYINKRDKITRQEFAENIVSEADLVLSRNYEVTFKDVPNESIYTPYIYTLKELGIMQGYDTETFGYDDNLTREQAFAIIMRLYNYLNEIDFYDTVINKEPDFVDMDEVSPWAINAIRAAYNLNIVYGTTDNELIPNEDLTFEDAERITNRVINK